MTISVKSSFGLTFLILVSFGLQAQSSLEISVFECKNATAYFYLDKISVYHDDTLFRVVENRGKNQFDLKNIPNGNYRIDYESKFGRIESVAVSITEKAKYEATLCYDFLDPAKVDHVPFIDQLQNGETYAISVRSSGCFHFSTDSITVKKEDDHYYASHAGGAFKMLNQTDIQALQRFETELILMNNEGCTTVDDYALTYNEFYLYVSDGSCQWHGWSTLKKELGWS